MKKIGIVMICLALMFCLEACGNNTENNSTEEADTVESECKEYSDQEFANIDIELTGGTLFVVLGDALSLTYDDGEEVDYSISDDTLYISQRDFNDMVLTLPGDSYGAVTITVDKGKLIMEESLNVNQLILKVDNGEVNLEKLDVIESCHMNVNQGSIYFYGTLVTTDASCQEGHIQINTTYKQIDYNYELSTFNGHILLDDDYYDETSNTIDNEAEYTMTLSSTSGDITIEFEYE
ncbi:MAG: DUF4097 domain-containing protein [Erysipelotrichaceae bacterium]|nr:DUF4097 domain-containing protein [Erysipelotrichaceae bacterium]